ncbi:MAG: hypothetical protein FWG88_10425 [Oscillospiraceae bacterium]|nr:hypothetical protein [Oscillospiraceae bacterium]
MSNSKITVAFRLNGGIGTYLVELNFIKFFYDAFPDVIISVFGSTSEAVNAGLMNSQYFIAKYHVRSMFREYGYDLIIDLNWFPKVIYVNMPKIQTQVPGLPEIIKQWVAFETDPATNNFIRNDSIFDYNIYTYAIANKKNRLNVMDINEALGIESQFRYTLYPLRDELDVLNKFGLSELNYITLQQGVNADSNSKQSPKQWPIHNFNVLCRLLKHEYPDIILVQLGELANNEPIEGVDMNYLGDTDFEELKILLKNAFLHIDGECGMMHMRKAMLAGPSVVLYGQTPIEIYSYDDNLNIYTNVCMGCSKLFSGWKRRCLLKEPICMTSITPEMVLNVIRNHIENETKYKTIKLTKLQELLSDSTIKLDPEWVELWLKERIIYDYWVEKIKLKDLLATNLTENGYVPIPLEETAAFKYISGNHQQYIEYIKLNDIYNPGHERTLEKIDNLIEQLNTHGYNQNQFIVIDGNNIIFDGSHRASWLMYMYGGDYEVETIKIYLDENTGSVLYSQLIEEISELNE